jgi:heme A synthase
VLLTLLLDPLGAIGLGEAIIALSAYFLIAVVLGLILYFWIRHTRRIKDLHRRGLITSVQYTVEEERARLNQRRRSLRVAAVLILVLVLFALYQG